VVSVEVILWLSVALVGFGILLISFLGGGDGDASGDMGGGHEMAGAESPGLSPLSTPMIAAFLVTAGGTGAILAGTGNDPLVVVGWAVALGVVVFLGTFIFVAKFLVDAQSSSLVNEKEYEGKTGVVTETIPEDGMGAVALTVRGTRYVVSARGSGRKIAMGTEVLVKHVANSVASVEELKSV